MMTSIINFLVQMIISVLVDPTDSSVGYGDNNRDLCFAAAAAGRGHRPFGGRGKLLTERVSYIIVFSNRYFFGFYKDLWTSRHKRRRRRWAHLQNAIREVNVVAAKGEGEEEDVI